jgi:hypothetical protein
VPFPFSAASVTTRETLNEFVVSLKALRIVYPSLPVFVGCPPDVLAEVAGLPGCHPVELALDKPSTVAERNTFHRSDAILMKMAALEAALAAHPEGCLFFDADLILLAPVPAPTKECDLYLSLNLSELDGDMTTSIAANGLFNAGLLWTRSPDFPAWWRENYLNPRPRDFYEQGCLSRAHTHFRIDYIPSDHNYGWWRGEPGTRAVSSIHVHLTDDLPLSVGMRNMSLPLRREAMLRLPHPVLEELRDRAGHARRLFFVHYGKSAGVYCCEAFKLLMRGADLLDSWHSPHSLGRDWTTEELRSHLQAPATGRSVFLHQHHVSVTADDIILAQEHGWTTVMFYRDPREIICSLYHFFARRLRERGPVSIFGETLTEMPPFESFFDEVLDHPRLWALPRWHVLLDHCLPFSPENLDRVCDSLFKAPHPPSEPRNTSENPGWEATLTLQQLESLSELPDFTRSMAWLSRFPAP